MGVIGWWWDGGIATPCLPPNQPPTQPIHYPPPLPQVSLKTIADLQESSSERWREISEPQEEKNTRAAREDDRGRTNTDGKKSSPTSATTEEPKLTPKTTIIYTAPEEQTRKYRRTKKSITKRKIDR